MSEKPNWRRLGKNGLDIIARNSTMFCDLYDHKNYHYINHIYRFVNDKHARLQHCNHWCYSDKTQPWWLVGQEHARLYPPRSRAMRAQDKGVRCVGITP